ncbi:MAG: hypothetical protein Q9201_000001 [Fulgogasparrea decipioides]
MPLFPKYEYGVCDKGWTRKRLDKKREGAPVTPNLDPSDRSGGRFMAVVEPSADPYGQDNFDRHSVAADRSGARNQYVESRHPSQYVEQTCQASPVSQASRQQADSSSQHRGKNQQGSYIDPPPEQLTRGSAAVPLSASSHRHCETNQPDSYHDEPEGRFTRNGSIAISQRVSTRPERGMSDSQHPQGSQGRQAIPRTGINGSCLSGAAVHGVPCGGASTLPTQGHQQDLIAAPQTGPDSRYTGISRRDYAVEPYGGASQHQPQRDNQQASQATLPASSRSRQRESRHPGLVAATQDHAGSRYLEESKRGSAVPHSRYHHSPQPYMTGARHDGPTSYYPQDLGQDQPIASRIGAGSHHHEGRQRALATAMHGSSNHDRTLQKASQGGVDSRQPPSHFVGGSVQASQGPSVPRRRDTKRQVTLLSGQRVTVVNDTKI